MQKEKFFELLGWVGMTTSILMYVFYFQHIQQNLGGHKGNFLQPFMAGINCTFWHLLYLLWGGAEILFLPERDIRSLYCNVGKTFVTLQYKFLFV